MKKFLLLFLFLPSFIFSSYEDKMSGEYLIHQGREAYGENKFEDAFTCFDLYLLAYTNEQYNSLARIEARIGRFCASYKLGYLLIAQNEMGLIKMILNCPDKRIALLKQFPQSMLGVAAELY